MFALWPSAAFLSSSAIRALAANVVGKRRRKNGQHEEAEAEKGEKVEQNDEEKKRLVPVAPSFN